METLDQVAPILAAVMFGIFAVFVVFGMLFGMGRGLKRSALRLGIFISLLLVAFFVTPFIIKSGLNLNITINGMTPAQWVDDMSNRLIEFMQESFGNYITPFQDYIKDFAIGMVLALLNLVLFIVLYIIVKVISWIIYAIVAHFVAPKRDHNGNKKPKHIWWGLLVGALQGVLLFLFFMLPFNGVIGVVNQAANYKAMQAQGSSNESAPQAYQSSWNGDDDYYYEQNTSSGDTVDMVAVLKKVDSALSGYNMMMRYTGLQFLSNKAFEYQLTVRLDGKTQINLVHDIHAGVELYMDAQALADVIEKFEQAFNNNFDMSQITTEDYKVLHKFIGKAFDLQILKVADRLLTDLDTIFNTPFGDDKTYLEGTDIYADSIYGLLIKQNTTEREIPYTAAADEIVPTNYAQYAQGLRAVVNYVAKQKLNLVKNDVLSILDLVEAVGSYKITCNGSTETQTLFEVLSHGTMGVRDYFDVVTARLATKQDKYAAGTPLLNVLGDRLKQFSIVKMMGLTNVDNLITYSKMFENQSDESMQTFMYDFAALFLGDSAFDKDGNKGNWEKLGGIIYDAAEVARDNADLIDDITQLAKDGNMDMQGLIDCIGELIVTEDYYNTHKNEFTADEYNDEVKYQKVEQLVDLLYDVVTKFEPVRTFMVDRLNDMAKPDENGEGGNQMYQTLADMLQSEKPKWLSTIRGLVSAANVINNENVKEIMDKMQGSEQLAKEDVAQLLDTMVTELKPDDVGNLVETVLELEGIGDTVKEVFNGALQELNPALIKEFFKDEKITDEDFAKVESSIATLKEFFGDNETSVTNDDMKAAVADLWKAVQNSNKIKEYLNSEGSAE